MDSYDTTSTSIEVDQKQKVNQADLEKEYNQMEPLAKQPTLPGGAMIEIPEHLGTSDTIAKRFKSVGSVALSHNIIEGYLMKYSPSFLKGWQKRYVILKDKRLYYKKTKEQPYPNGVVNFDHFQCFLLTNSKDPLQFQIKVEG